MPIDSIAARIDDRYAMPIVINNNFVALPLKLVIDGATQPTMISGTMKKIIWLVICLITSKICTATVFNVPLSGDIRNPSAMPIIMAIISLAAVLLKSFLRFIVEKISHNKMLIIQNFTIFTEQY